MLKRDCQRKPSKMTAQSTGSHREIGGGIQIPKPSCKLYFLFPRPPERPRELARRLTVGLPLFEGKHL